MITEKDVPFKCPGRSKPTCDCGRCRTCKNRPYARGWAQQHPGKVKQYRKTKDESPAPSRSDEELDAAAARWLEENPL